ncbi:MAG: zinc-dependent peptidase [Thiogranum sp.]|nr:zinc-dependent peptidase [Thiogranum sp.]
MFNYLRQWRRKRIIRRSRISEDAWKSVFAQLPILGHLSAAEKDRLRDLAVLFLNEKSFFGAHGLEVTEHMRLLIALQACLPILHLGLDWYAGWSTIIVYPAGFAPVREVEDEFGLVHTVREELIGEAWHDGPVILSWEDSGVAGAADAKNVVIHEFIHKLDMLNGAADGFPPMHANVDAETWSATFSAAFADFQEHPKPGLDDYGATDPAEFLAVLSEVFFENPVLLNGTYPEVYGALSRFFRQNPIQNPANPASDAGGAYSPNSRVS